MSGWEAPLSKGLIVHPDGYQWLTGRKLGGSQADVGKELIEVSSLLEGRSGERLHIGEWMHVGVAKSGDNRAAREMLLGVPGFPQVGGPPDSGDPPVADQQSVADNPRPRPD
jgi:hypothetical protein